jgi:hypothetical protein
MDLSKLAPSDAVVALRSLERRYRSLLTDLDEDDESPYQIAIRPGADGWSALGHVVAAARAIAASSRALSAVLTRTLPRLDPINVDPAARPRPGPPTGTVHERLAELGLEATRLADRAQRVAPAEWNRQGTVDDGSARQITALDIVRAAVDAGITHLGAAKRTLDEVRGR